MWKDFKAFAMKGNIMELAIAVIIGAAFGKMVSSLVADIVTPLLGIVLGGVDVSGLAATFGDTTLKYGLFLQSIIDFFIVSFSIFLFIRLLGKLKRKEKVEEGQAEKEIVLTGEEKLLIEIRDLLREQSNRNRP
ncbi:large conductance mechanosensitive channel protein MscL [Paenibacillus albicereus]|uniref:Large-conductance mechanosensitive channel n=1 Tax=Paenibacillus albicereus TaxID=2726185 RepID=A0A6H2GZX3_9BACL|nr:large conductance mechanosensitive channel protein MscL [Paenibacillus albicereus]QJC52716.1 large conductance mechanosensitive channel protein MscL [Paenibacillus albicereus]